MGVVSACALSFMSKYLHQSCSPKPMTRVDINDNNQSSNNTFTNNSWKVIKVSLIIAKGEKVGTLYLCTHNVESSIVLVLQEWIQHCGIIGLGT
jgi:hypothetical protein